MAEPFMIAAIQTDVAGPSTRPDVFRFRIDRPPGPRIEIVESDADADDAAGRSE